MQKRSKAYELVRGFWRHCSQARPVFEVVVGIALLTLAANDSWAYDLDRHLWRDRLLFLVAPSADDADIAAQQSWLRQRQDAVRDRDLRVFELFVKQGRVDDQVLAPSSVERLRARLGLSERDRQVILIGKDGGIKRRAALNTDLREIFLQIDGMPMRQRGNARQEAGRYRRDSSLTSNQPCRLVHGTRGSINGCRRHRRRGRPVRPCVRAEPAGAGLGAIGPRCR